MSIRLTIGLVLGAVFLLPLLAGAESQARFSTIQDNEVDDSANSRRDSWMAAIRIAQDYPVLGVGVRNSNLYSRLYGADMEKK